MKCEIENRILNQNVETDEILLCSLPGVLSNLPARRLANNTTNNNNSTNVKVIQYTDRTITSKHKYSISMTLNNHDVNVWNEKWHFSAEEPNVSRRRQKWVEVKAAMAVVTVVAVEMMRWWEEGHWVVWCWLWWLGVVSHGSLKKL